MVSLTRAYKSSKVGWSLKKRVIPNPRRVWPPCLLLSRVRPITARPPATSAARCSLASENSHPERLYRDSTCTGLGLKRQLETTQRAEAGEEAHEGDDPVGAMVGGDLLSMTQPRRHRQFPLVYEAPLALPTSQQRPEDVCPMPPVSRSLSRLLSFAFSHHRQDRTTYGS